MGVRRLEFGARLRCPLLRPLLGRENITKHTKMFKVSLKENSIHV